MHLIFAKVRSGKCFPRAFTSALLIFFLIWLFAPCLFLLFFIRASDPPFHCALFELRPHVTPLTPKAMWPLSPTACGMFILTVVQINYGGIIYTEDISFLCFCFFWNFPPHPIIHYIVYFCQVASKHYFQGILFRIFFHSI